MRRNLIAVGGSAGALTPLRSLVLGLGKDAPVCVLVVIHVARTAPSVLPEILTRVGGLPAKHAADRDSLEPGKILVAPPNRHLLIQRKEVRLGHGPQENRHRPAIDPLFRSAARFAPSRTIGIVLSGLLDDGIAGASALRRAGGIVIVQAPSDAEFPQLPESVIREGLADHVVGMKEMAALVKRLMAEEVSQKAGMGAYDATASENEPEISAAVEVEALKEELLGPPSALTCPDCHGALWEVHEGQLVRYECRVAHRFSKATLIEAQDDMIEESVLIAYRALEEKAATLLRFAELARDAGLHAIAQEYELKRDDTLGRAETLRRALQAMT
ncbi:MAG: chemotaxis protein CheB [Polyangiaceae bacterium]|nr:chemotaxis protein CheB [Polyangiaceae bacterium]